MEETNRIIKEIQQKNLEKSEQEALKCKKQNDVEETEN